MAHGDQSGLVQANDRIASALSQASPMLPTEGSALNSPSRSL